MTRITPRLFGTILLASALTFGAGCARMTPEKAAEQATVNLELRSLAIQEVNSKRARGIRVWCVPFARTASGIEIRGNAHTWWHQAKGEFERTETPHVGSVMVFSKSSRLRLGHVAVVSKVISDREIRIDHANWKRNRVSLEMGVIDVSEKGDWSRVRVESNPGQYGGVYPVSGFILPDAV